MQSTIETCSVHRFHTPQPHTAEWHHIIPVSWQLFHQPQDPFVKPFPGQDTDRRGLLWDNRGIWICPTGHRNVHYWIVLMMKAIDTSDDPVVAYKKTQPKRVPKEFDIAYQALTRYRTECMPEPNSSLLALTAVDKWGQA